MHSEANADAKNVSSAHSRQRAPTQPNAMSGSKLGSNGLALSLLARMVMGQSQRVAGADAMPGPPKLSAGIDGLHSAATMV